MNYTKSIGYEMFIERYRKKTGRPLLYLIRVLALTRSKGWKQKGGDLGNREACMPDRRLYPRKGQESMSFKRTRDLRLFNLRKFCQDV